MTAIIRALLSVTVIASLLNGVVGVPPVIDPCTVGGFVQGYLTGLGATQIGAVLGSEISASVLAATLPADINPIYDGTIVVLGQLVGAEISNWAVSILNKEGDDIIKLAHNGGG